MSLRSILQTFIGHRLFRPWLTVLAGAVVLTLLIVLEALPDEAGLIRDVQARSFPGRDLSDAVRAVTTTSFVVLLGVLIAIGHQLEGDRRAAMVLIVLLVVLVGAQAGIKQIVDRPRPAEVEPAIEVRASQTSPSFPAGHVMGPTVVYGWSLAWLLRRHPSASPAPAQATALVVATRLLVLTLAAILALTGLVNVWLGVHWPSDVAGGYLWGLVLLLPALAARSPAGSPR